MGSTTRVTPVEIDTFAHRLMTAEAEVWAIEPISEALPGLAIDDAYAIQARGRALRIAGGARLVGHKIGLTSKPMQEMVGVDQPDYGYLLDDQVFGDAACLAAERFVAPRVEGEIAFQLDRTVTGPDVTSRDVLDATRAVAPALEVIDSRIADWRITITDTIADNASCGAGVIGSWTELGGLGVDLAELDMELRAGDEVVRGRGDAVLGHPAESVAWLARALHARGEALEAGEIVLSGALARALVVTPGSSARAAFGALGSVSVTF